MIRQRARGVAMTIAIVLGAGSCGRDRKAESGDPSVDLSRRPAVSDNGGTITFPPGSPGLGQIGTTGLTRTQTVIAVTAPARVVASIAASGEHPENVVLFESADANNAWSQYRQARVAVDRTTRVLERVRQMYQNLGATAREVAEAETDAETARASAAEQESRMRALGFNPAELEAVTGAIAWLMADVPEAELHNVQRGGTVKIRFASFPELDVEGRTEALGDIVDPMTRSVRVRVVVPNADRRLLPGMFAKAAFGDPRRDVLVLPTSAVITVEEQSFVFIRTGVNAFRRKPVTIQRAGADSVIVLAGLSNGEQVVTSGAMLLKGLSFGY
jgi:cobalt-zinc-cadmium efflux system membrane fusion protein